MIFITNINENKWIILFYFAPPRQKTEAVLFFNSTEKMTNLFAGRQLAIGTKHQKEEVIAPVFESALHVKPVVPPGLDTDLLGTFTGETERAHDALTCAKKKCLMAMELTGCDMAVASEGSFGAHPQLPFAHAHEEILVFTDRKHDLEIVWRELSLKTNFSGKFVSSYQELEEFAEQALFPSHALILRKSPDETIHIFKGIVRPQVLRTGYNYLSRIYRQVYVETDMRAMFNPMRMQAIQKVAGKLVEKICTCCTSCGAPGFGLTDVERGLPCSACHHPTRSIKSYIYRCEKCFHKEIKLYPDEKTTEDPMYCDNCNP